MPTGKTPNFSKIVQAIAQAEEKTTGEIRVHLSRRWWEPNPLARAQRLFQRFGMSSTQNRNAVLLYVNLRHRRFAVFGDPEVHEKLGQGSWNRIVTDLARDLRSTHSERAIAETVLRIGRLLAQHFPLDPLSSEDRHNELPNDVTQD